MSAAAGAPDVVLGGRGYVRLRDSDSGKEILLPADAELSAEEADRHYERSSEVMAKQVERGKAPWLKAREPGYALPENVDRGSPFRGQNAVWLVAAADHRGYSDHRWGTAGDVEAAGGRVREVEREKGIMVLLWREHWKSGAPRTFGVTVYNAEQCEGLPPREPATQWRASPPEPRQLLALAAIEQGADRRPRYDPDRDVIEMPPKAGFADERAYLRAGIRQLGHWTGHSSRLARETLAAAAAAGPASPAAAREELRGEIHALLAGCRLGIGHAPARDPQREAAAARVLREDSREIYRAGNEAERMLGYAAERARPRPRVRAPAPAPDRGLASMSEMARELLANPPWERSR